METTPEDTHGHAVIDMMIASGDHYSTASLHTAIIDQFGTKATFCTCEESGLSATQLIDLLWSKGKFIGTAEAFTFDTAHRSNCQG